MFSTTFLIVALGLFAYANPVVVERAAPSVVSDLAAVASDTATLDKAIEAFSNTAGTLAQALVIHQDATNLGSGITKSTTDVKTSGAFSESDGTAVLSEFRTWEPIIIEALTDTAGKKSGFDRINATAIALNDLETLNTDTQAMEKALLSALPSDLLPQATPIVSAINAAFSLVVDEGP